MFPWSFIWTWCLAHLFVTLTNYKGNWIIIFMRIVINRCMYGYGSTKTILSSPSKISFSDPHCVCSSLTIKFSNDFNNVRIYIVCGQHFFYKYYISSAKPSCKEQKSNIFALHWMMQLQDCCLKAGGRCSNASSTKKFNIFLERTDQMKFVSVVVSNIGRVYII
jgi:hypothetical protein